MFCSPRSSQAKKTKQQRAKGAIFSAISKKFSSGKSKSNNGTNQSADEHAERMEIISRMEITRRLVALERYNDELKRALTAPHSHAYPDNNEVGGLESIEPGNNNSETQVNSTCEELKKKLAHQDEVESQLRKKLQSWESWSEEVHLKDQSHDIERLKNENDSLRKELISVQSRLEETVAENNEEIGAIMARVKSNDDSQRATSFAGSKIEQESYERMRAAIEEKWRQCEVELRCTKTERDTLKTTMSLERKQTAPLLEQIEGLKRQLTEKKIDLEAVKKTLERRLKAEQESKSKVIMDLKQLKEGLLQREQEVSTLKVLLQPLTTLIPTTEVIVTTGESTAASECDDDSRLHGEKQTMLKRDEHDSGVGMNSDMSFMTNVDNNIDEVEKRFDRISDTCDDVETTRIDNSDEVNKRPGLSRQGSNKSDIRSLLLSRMCGVDEFPPSVETKSAITLAVARQLQQRNTLSDLMESVGNNVDGFGRDYGDSYHDTITRHQVRSSQGIASLRDLHPSEMLGNNYIDACIGYDVFD